MPPTECLQYDGLRDLGKENRSYGIKYRRGEKQKYWKKLEGATKSLFERLGSTKTVQNRQK